jgi:tetratricopeptide (TPR) repeat protein
LNAEVTLGFKLKPSHCNGSFPVPLAALGWAFVLVLVLWASAAVAQETEADVYVAQATLAYDGKRYPEALSLLSEALRIEPENVQALYYTGLVHLAQKNPALAVEYLEKARAKAPTTPIIQYELGVAYFTLEQYDKAEPLLAEVFKEQPRMENLGYYIGFMRYRQKDYNGALKAFKTGASTDPTMQQLTTFYAGLTLGILGLPESAAAEIEESLKLQPATSLTGPAERIRESIVKAREREQRLRAEIRLGGFYDDNVSVNPQRSTDPQAEQARTNQSRSFGEIASLRADYSWLRKGPWEATATYSFFQTVYNNDGTSNFNLQDHLGSLGGFYRGTVRELPFQLGLQYSYDWLSLGGNPFLTRHTATAFGTLVENAGNLTTMVGRLAFKNFLQDYLTPPASNRDGQNWMVGPTHVFRFNGDRHLIRIGYQFDIEDTEGRDFSYKGHRALTGGQYTLPWGETRLRYDYEVHFRAYGNPNSLPQTSTGTMVRRDTEQIHYFRIEKPLPNNLTLSTEYQGDFSQSNLAVFNFHRNVFTVLLTWTY